MLAKLITLGYLTQVSSSNFKFLLSYSEHVLDSVNGDLTTWGFSHCQITHFQVLFSFPVLLSTYLGIIML